MNPHTLLTQSLLELQRESDGLINRLHLASPLRDEEVASILKQHLHCSSIDLSLEKPTPAAIHCIPYEVALQRTCLPPASFPCCTQALAELHLRNALS